MNPETLQTVNYILTFGAGIITGVIACTIIAMTTGTKTTPGRRRRRSRKCDIVPTRILKLFENKN